MFQMISVQSIARTLATLALAAGLTAAPEAADASTNLAGASLADATLACPEGTEVAYFGLPIDAPARMSTFAYRVDGGAWAFTNWYYSSAGSYWIFESGRWSGLAADASAAFLQVGNNRVVEAFEYRYDPASGRAAWAALGSCRTTSFFQSGIVFN